MKDPKRDIKKQLQTAYFSLLNGNVSAPVYDAKPTSPEYPHVGIGEWTKLDGSDKSSQGDELTLTLTLVDRFTGPNYTRSRLYQLSDEVQQIICQTPAPFELEGFNVITSTLDNETTGRQLTDTHIELFTALRFRHTTQQID